MKIIFENLLISLSLIFPLIISGFLHMFIVKKNILSVLNKPISKKLFGHNKTYRGFILMPVLSYVGLLAGQTLPYFKQLNLSQYQVMILGLLLGLFYCIFELPNSWMKRKLNIEPGKTPKKNKFIFIFIDQSDSVVGCLCVYSYFLNLSATVIFLVVSLGPALHLLVNYVLYALKLRKEPS